MKPDPLADCRWQGADGAAQAQAAIAFLRRIGIPVERQTLRDDTLLPGLDVRRGVMMIDPQIAVWPGDLLHEAGHIAVTDPSERASRETIPVDGGEEMAAIAWSVAAASASNMPLEVLFHDAGYKGGSQALIAAFAGRDGPGVPLLTCWGMTDPAQGFPAMSRWLR